MAQIKTTDIINGQEVSAEVQKVVKSLNELMKQLGSLSVQYQKSTGSSKKLTDAERESARIAKEEAKAQKDIENAQKSLQRQRQRGLAAMAKEEAKKRELIATSKQEITTLRSAEQKLKAMKEVYRSMPQGTEAARKSAEQYRLEIQRLDSAVKKGGAGIGEYNRSVGNYPKDMGQATKSTSGFTKGLAAMAAAATVAIAALRRVSQYVKQSIDLFLEQDKVNRQVQNVFGDYGAAINKAANETQKFTTVGNEQYQKLAIQMKNFGIANKDINESVQGTIGLAEKYATVGLSQETALKGVALAMNGNYSQLERYIPALRNANTEEEKAAILKKEMAAGFEFAKQNAQTYSGRITQMKNAYGDLKEVVGGQILGGIFDPKEGDKAVSTINKIAAVLEKTKFVSTLLKTIGALLAPIGRAFKNIFNIIAGGESDANTLEDSLNGINKTVKILLAPLTALTKSMEWLTEQVKKLGINFVPLLAALGVYAARVKIIAITTKIASAAKAAYAVVTGVLTGKIKLAEIAQKKMNAATKANIYVAMASAAVALGVALYKVYQNSDKVAALQKDINKAYEEATKSIGNQKAELNSLLTTAKNHNLSLTDRKAAIEKINEISPEYLGNITLENLYTTETATAINDYNKALQNKAKQQALLSITSEKYAKVLELQYEREQLGTGRYANKKYNDLTTEINALNDEILQVETSFQKLFATETPTNKIEPAIQSVIDKIDELWNEAALGDADALIELNNIMGTSYDKVALSTVGAADAIQAYKQSLIDASKDSNKKLEEEKEALKAQKEAIDAANKAYQKYLETIKGINDEYDLMIQFLKSDADIKQAAIDRDKKLFDASLDYYKKVTPEMQKMIDSYSIITVEAEKLNKIGGLNIVNEQDIQLIKEATEEAKSYHQTMMDIANSFDVSTLKSQTFFEKMAEAAAKFGEFWEQNGKAITTVLGSIGDAVNQHYENQIGLLETQQEKTDAYWDRQIERYEGDEAAQKQLEQAKANAAIETQRKIIDEQRKAAIFNKAQALVDIAINTAVGISKALAAANPILATAIGISGAIQAGIVASQPLPQYKIGLDSAKEDHVGIVADAGPELVHYPDGSSALFSKPTVTFLPKFSSVDTAQETQAKFKSMEFQNNMYKFTANNEKQVKLLSTIARNTSKNGMREQDVFFIKRYAK